MPSEAEVLASQGDEESLRRAVALEPGRADAVVPLARILHERGEDEEALGLLANVSGSFAADALAARIRREKLGTPDVSEAVAALDAGEVERGLDLLLDAIPSAGDAQDDLRAIVVGVLDDLGVDDPRARDYRRRLATALY